MIYAQQTDVGLRACTGDWCFYIQSDEIMHHDALPVIREACAKYLDDRRVEGFLLKYVHLYGDYRHYIDSLHFAYPREIRIVRNRPDIHSWRDAQSFRVIPDFNGVDYDVEEGTRKLRCILLDALIFHYGWSRDPRCMVRKANHHNALYSKDYKPVEGVDYYDYGNLGMMPLYEGRSRRRPRSGWRPTTGRISFGTTARAPISGSGMGSSTGWWISSKNISCGTAGASAGSRTTSC